MIKLEPLLGLKCKTDNEGLVYIELSCDYPEERKNCLEFFKGLEEIKIKNSNITFPTRLIHWIITINPIDKPTIMNYFRIDGILKIVQENKSKLIGKQTFVKAEINYPNKSKFPNLHIHFYQVSEDKGTEVFDVEDMVEHCMIHYSNTKQFTAKRIKDLEKYVNTLELKQIPFLPMEEVLFDSDDNVLPFTQHLLAKQAVELPF